MDGEGVRSKLGTWLIQEGFLSSQGGWITALQDQKASVNFIPIKMLIKYWSLVCFLILKRTHSYCKLCISSKINIFLFIQSLAIKHTELQVWDGGQMCQMDSIFHFF